MVDVFHYSPWGRVGRFAIFPHNTFEICHCEKIQLQFSWPDFKHTTNGSAQGSLSQSEMDPENYPSAYSYSEL